MEDAGVEKKIKNYRLLTLRKAQVDGGEDCLYTTVRYQFLSKGTEVYL